jgi:hypothetical protein
MNTGEYSDLTVNVCVIQLRVDHSLNLWIYWFEEIKYMSVSQFCFCRQVVYITGVTQWLITVCKESVAKLSTGNRVCEHIRTSEELCPYWYRRNDHRDPQSLALKKQNCLSINCTRLSYTGLIGGLEHLKIEWSAEPGEMFASPGSPLWNAEVK